MAYGNLMNYGNPRQSDSIFTGDLDKDGTIYSIGMGRERVKVGVDSEKEQEYLRAMADMQEPLDSYYQKLIQIRQYLIDVYDDRDMVNQLSAFAPKQSPEDIAREAANEQMRLAQEQAAQQAEINQSLLGLIEKLSNDMKELKTNGNNRLVDESCNEQIGQNSENNRKITKPSKSRAPARTKANS